MVNNKNENIHKERRMIKRTKIRKVIIKDNKSFCQIILQNLTKISTEVYRLKPFEIAILVKFDFEGQNSCFKKLRY